MAKTNLTPTQEINNINLIVGGFINLTVEIETAIDLIISNHFYNDDSVFKLHEFIFPYLTFRSKCEILDSILSKCYKTEYSIYKSKLDLSKVRNKRNKFAHTQVYYHTNKNNVKDYTKIEFIRYDNMKQGKDVISIKDLDDDLKNFTKQLRVLQDLNKKIYPSL